MYKTAIKYKDVWLAPGSGAHQLHQDKKFKELDALIKALEAKERQLLGPEPAETARKRALDVPARYPFKEAPATDAVPVAVDNGADPAFMKLLEEGAHLDIERFPL